MREVFQEISVQPAPSGAPFLARWGTRTLRALEVLDAWRAGGRWWLGEAPRAYYLVSFAGLTAEVYREDRAARLPGFEHDPSERWVLARIVD